MDETWLYTYKEKRKQGEQRCRKGSKEVQILPLKKGSPKTKIRNGVCKASHMRKEEKKTSIGWKEQR